MTRERVRQQPKFQQSFHLLLIYQVKLNGVKSFDSTIAIKSAKKKKTRCKNRSIITFEYINNNKRL